MDAEAKAQMYADFLREEGYQPKIDGDGDVIFKHEGRTYYIDVNDDDKYFQLVFPTFWDIESEEERARVAIAANDATYKTKVAKVVAVRDFKDVSAYLEVFLTGPEEFKPIFARCLTALQGAVGNFKEKMDELKRG